MQKIIAQIAQELRVHQKQVQAAVDLLDGGASVPFIARYRKEATDGLDDIQLRELEARLGYLRELRDRLQTVIKAIDEQGKLTPELMASLAAASTKQELEDLYLPFKLKRRTKGQLAREAGLEPLADALFANPALVPADEAQAYVIPMRPVVEGEDKQPDFSTVPAVLDGVRDLLSERWAENPAVVQDLREWLWHEGLFKAKLMDGKDENHPDVAKFRDYFDYDEPIGRVPSHRALAVFRGRGLEILDAKLVVLEPNQAPAHVAPSQTAIKTRVTPTVSLAEGRIALKLGWSHQGRAADDLIRKCVAWTWRVKLSLSTERDLFTRLREDAERVAIKVFADNLRDLLLAAPAGPRVVLGLDPGIRTGVKVAVVDATGKLVDTSTVYPHEPRKDWDGSLHILAKLCEKHGVNLIAIGNGTASRETDKLAADLIKLMAKSAAAQEGQARAAIEKVVVSEAGASVYSASEFASQEMPDVDVSLRGAASIARRLQDPLAELVKIDPKSIGVGQYQHDVNQSELAKTLDAVVEDCVNAVGVDLNMASVPLLSRVSGLSGSVAKAVVRWREANGAFANRQQLLKVTGLGPKAFEQSAGFLRIRGGDNPLDMTGVHPETYPVVEQIIAKTGQPVAALMGRSDMLKTLRPELFANEKFGVITVKDILGELEKPGRDPRPDFKVARFNDGVEDIRDLKEGMVLEGTVSNVAAFGAFIDLGVHQDGLVHVSQLSHKFVTDAREIVKTGDIVKVQVVEVDVARKRIALTMKLGAAPSRQGSAGDNRFQGAANSQRGGRGAQGASPSNPPATSMSSAFAKLKGVGR
ncbi:MAG: RNA-binding transcriptional accessory protein [Gammaproteobacteria bacterium]|uniref:Tex family protein n=1 Tax=Rhodoferax sp. TaxID=50421 RepID=UPI0018209754|nr:Tex family protein [Rhodoferax sp.]MBU3899678.1 RNA-binding transcriptional accessory protein [Gammaproteobacteria bacterium]MBA3058374.1 RNA-binding transcriptional accessory protein [Rhodoferax sp.]MBU3996244.1 RNA-binding transcriptional accessory protein [Gammaproteobacteria bacterium]MBU4018154.1 RNA-binding transcriptional accessory protein [Gammaproteobacteria bacterium]MBU4080155.1 RNA-binding transcriptional accessory protein [Gammaproteobacteria bacterium]